MIELLAPAGDLQRAKIAYDYGADAVYVGGKRFSLRAKASNFDLDAIEEIVNYAHDRQKRLYVTVNMLAHEEDLEGLDTYILDLSHRKVDAIIVASLSIAIRSKKLAPTMEVHLSTQLSITNAKALEYYRSLGLDRVVLARELDAQAVKSVTSAAVLETEIFIHGGMCVNYSGRCTLSNQMTLRDANRGGCAQSCRWYYDLRKGDTKLSLDENPFTMGSKDLSTLPWIETFVEAGIHSLKIEGRMKSAYYIAVVVKTYRRMVDAILEKKLTPQLMSTLERELQAAEGRLTFDGFYSHLPNVQDHLYLSKKTSVQQNFVGQILNVKDEWALIELKNPIQIGDALEVFSPQKNNQTFTVTQLRNEFEEDIAKANIPNSKIWINVPMSVSVNSFIRKESV